MYVYTENTYGNGFIFGLILSFNFSLKCSTLLKQTKLTEALIFRYKEKYIVSH